MVFDATSIRPSSSASPSVASPIRGMTRFGTMSTCTGACGFTSWKAKKSSSSCTIFAGISRLAIFSKMVMVKWRWFHFSHDGKNHVVARAADALAQERDDLGAQRLAVAAPDFFCPQPFHAAVEVEQLEIRRARGEHLLHIAFEQIKK